jgi:hypothetical protein
MTGMNLKAFAGVTFMSVASSEKLVMDIGEVLEGKVGLVYTYYRIGRVERLRANVLYYGLLTGGRTRRVMPL